MWVPFMPRYLLPLKTMLLFDLEIGFQLLYKVFFYFLFSILKAFYDDDLFFTFSLHIPIMKELPLTPFAFLIFIS